MSSLPPFLAELGIVDDGQTLDERALRRAYARRLKQIDIEADPQGFQQLREALETALRWSAARERAREAQDAPEAMPAAPAEVVAEPVATAESVGAQAFARFKEHVDAVFRDESAAHSAVQHALRDERLINIDARTFFEWSVARLLAEGWQPGHQHLLDPAIEAFGWNSDHGRLSNFGQVGALLTAAIRDRTVAQGFTPAQQAAIAPLLERLREARPPDPATLRDEVEALQFLVQRVPSWLRIVTPVDPVNARFKMWSERPQAPAAAPVLQPQPRFVTRKPTSDVAIVAVVLTILLSLVAQLGGKARHMPAATPQPRPVLVDADSTRDLQQRQRRAEEMLDAIRRSQGAAPAHRPASQAARTDRQTATPVPFPAPGSGPPDAGQAWWTPSWAKDQPALQSEPR